MKPSQVAATLRGIASKIEASKNPDRNLVARDLKRIVAEVVAAPAAISENENMNVTSFYVDWEGRGYTHDRLQKDLEIMKKSIGNGPIYAGSTRRSTATSMPSSCSVTSYAVPAVGNVETISYFVFGN